MADTLEKEIVIPTPDGQMDAFLSTPTKLTGPLPAIIVIQEAFGLNNHIQDVCRRFAKQGMIALAPDLFHRQGKKLVIPYTEFMKVMPILANLSNEGIVTDIKAARSYLETQPNVIKQKIGAVGFCMGGFAAMLSACKQLVDFAICFYSAGLFHKRPGIGLSPIFEEFDFIKVPVLLFFGENDTSIPLLEIEKIRNALTSLKVDHEIVIYPHAGHGFFCESRGAYSKEAAIQAWDYLLQWLNKKINLTV